MFILNANKMIYKEVTNIIIDTLKRFKGVNFVKYQGNDLNNQQQNYKTLQCYIDDISLHQFNITTNIVKASYEIYILGFPNDEESVLDIQDKCYDVAIYTLAMIDKKPEFKGIVRLYDYDILTLSRYTEQSNAGVKLSLVLEIPNGVNLCEVDDKFGEPYKEEEDKEIDVQTDDVGDLDISPIKLPRNRVC